MTCPTDRSEWSALLRSVLHLDFYAAIVCGVAAAVLLGQTSWMPSWTLTATVGSMTSAGLLTNAWRQRTALDQRLEKSDYGELVRMVDPTQDRMRAPYTVTIFVSLLALTCSATTAVILSITTQRTVTVIFVAMTAGLLIWSALATLSLIRLDSLHNRSVSRLQSMREQITAAQRRQGSAD